jgi:hypothetical protein
MIRFSFAPGRTPMMGRNAGGLDVHPLTDSTGRMALLGLTDEWSEVGGARIHNALFNSEGKCLINFTDSSNTFFKAVIEP